MLWAHVDYEVVSVATLKTCCFLCWSILSSKFHVIVWISVKVTFLHVTQKRHTNFISCIYDSSLCCTFWWINMQKFYGLFFYILVINAKEYFTSKSTTVPQSYSPHDVCGTLFLEYLTLYCQLVDKVTKVWPILQHLLTIR